MRKEVVWAIIAGVALGVTVAFGIYSVNSNRTIVQEPISAPEQPTQTPLGTPSDNKITNIVIDKPAERDVIVISPVTISGLAKPLAWVLVNGASEDYLVKADEKGFFSGDISLIPGLNQLKITSIDTTGTQNSTNLNLVYSSSFQLNDGSNASDSSQTTKTAKEIAESLNKPKAYMGTVTNVTETTAQVKTIKSEIDQISFTPSVDVVNITGKNNKAVKPSDIAIGDFIIPMGYIGSNSVLAAQRILIADAPEATNLTSYQAKITSTSRNTLTVTTMPDGKEIELDPDVNTNLELFKVDKFVVNKFNDFTDGDLVIFVSTKNEDEETVIRSIFKIPQS